MAQQTLSVETAQKIKVRLFLLSVLSLAVGSIALAAFMVVRRQSKEYDLLINALKNLSKAGSYSVHGELKIQPEPREPETVVVRLPAGLPTNFTLQNLLFFLSSDFSSSFQFSLDFSSDPQKSLQNLNARLKGSGKLQIGGLEAAVDAEIMKQKEGYYILFRKVPPFIFSLFDLTAIQGKWVFIDSQEETPFSFQEIQNILMFLQQRRGEYAVKLETAIEEGFMTARINPSQRTDNDLQRYIISLDYTRYPAYVRSLQRKMKAPQRDDSSGSDFGWFEIFGDTRYKTLIEEFSKMHQIEIAVDRRSGYLKELRYTAKFSLPGRFQKFQGKQIRIAGFLRYDRINEQFSPTPPREALSFDEAVSLMTNIPLEKMYFDRQMNNVRKIRTALSFYEQYFPDTYPETLEELLKPLSSQQQQPAGKSLPQFALLKRIPNDVYTQQPYSYRRVGNNYELQYLVQNKPMPTSYDFSGTISPYALFYGYLSHNDLLIENNTISVGDIFLENNYLQDFSLTRPGSFAYFFPMVVEGINTADRYVLSREGAGRRDSDNDGLFDSDEVRIYGTDPYFFDTDGDGYLDGEEVRYGYNPLGSGKMGAQEGMPEPQKKEASSRAGEESEDLPSVKYRDAKRLFDIRQMSTILELLVYENESVDLIGCDGDHVAVQLCADSSGRALFSRYRDPGLPRGVCRPESTDVCEYSISRSNGGWGPTADDYQICFWIESFEGGGGLYTRGLNRITTGGVIQPGCR